jgi:tetratricopeptide (TPR) repeat protein
VQVYYLMGEVHAAAGQADKAKSDYEQAAGARADRGELSDVRYYQALAQRKLGHEDRAARAFDELINYGTQRLQGGSDLDFFAKFGTRQSVAAQKARAHYLVGLGHLGKGQGADAKKAFEAALELNASHLGARTMLAALP